MAAKKSTGKSEPKAPKETPKKAASKPKKQEEDDNLDDDEDTDTDEESVGASAKKGAKVSSKKGKDDDEEEEEGGEDEVDEWEKPEEDDSWDPDFEEFDLPKSKAKKATGTAGGKKAGKGDDEDLSIDDEFKDMDLFNDSSVDDEDDDY